MHDNTKQVPVEELTLIFATVEDMVILTDDLTTDYFDAGSSKTQEGQRAIVYEFNRARAMMTAIHQLAASAKAQLEALGASR